MICTQAYLLSIAIFVLEPRLLPLYPVLMEASEMGVLSYSSLLGAPVPPNSLALTDFSVLGQVGSNAGIVGMTKEHLGLALALNVPVFVVVTKIDMCPANILQGE